MSTSILVISDDPLNATGFGTVIRNIFGRIHKNNKDIKITAISLFSNPSNEARAIDIVRPIVGDTHGVQTLLHLKESNNYDIIFLLGDWWYWSATLLNDEWKAVNNITEKIWYYVPLDGAILDLHQKKAYRTADKLIAMTPFGEEQLKACSFNQVEYIPHGYDHTVFYYRDKPINKDAFTIGIVSRNSQRKNIWAILSAVKRLITKLDIKLNVFIHTPVNDTAGGDLRKYIAYMKMEDFVEFTDGQKIGWPHIEGYKDEDMYHEVYSQIDCLVSAGREGFGLPYLEASACGIPLVLPNYSGHASMTYLNTVYYEVSDFRPDPSGVLDMVINVDELEKSISYAIQNLTITKPDFKYSMLRWDTIANKFERLILAEPKIVTEPITDFKEEAKLFNMTYGFDKEITIEKSILVVMPGSNGDVLLVTATLDGLHSKYPEHEIYLATKKQFFPIIAGSIIKVIEYNPELHDNYVLLHRKYDMVFTPHFDTQVTANWVHGGNSRSLAQVYANNCMVELGKYWIPEEKHPIPNTEYITLHVGSGKGEQYSRLYEKWDKVVNLLKTHKPNINILLLGTKSDLYVEGTIDLRGLMTINQMYYVINRARCHVGIDSFPMHVASIFGTPSVIIWGNTFPQSTGPELDFSHNLISITPKVRSKKCPRACHLVNCEHCKAALNSISETTIVVEVLSCIV